jgi:hypothetical protein
MGNHGVVGAREVEDVRVDRDGGDDDDVGSHLPTQVVVGDRARPALVSRNTLVYEIHGSTGAASCIVP